GVQTCALPIYDGLHAGQDEDPGRHDAGPAPRAPAEEVGGSATAGVFRGAGSGRVPRRFSFQEPGQMDFEHSPRAAEWIEKVGRFMQDRARPAAPENRAQVGLDATPQPPGRAALEAAARRAGPRARPPPGEAGPAPG